MSDAKPTKKKDRRPSDLIAAERIAGLSIEGIEKMACALVKSSPRTAEFLANSITQTIKANAKVAGVTN